ncbi:MAG: FxsA family protein [Halanaerobiales bacterium]|nr:FxsA family protein [Halanaerobiales bacterium]
MFLRLLLIFSVIPLVELALLIKVGGYIGTLWTIILVAGTGMIGITLARSQGFQLIGEIKSTLNQGQIPADHLIQGLLILIGAVMLLTPGLLTDTSGFILIIPITRKFVTRYVKKRVQKWINKGKFNVSYSEFVSRQNPNTDSTNSKKDANDSIDVNFEDIE